MYCVIQKVVNKKPDLFGTPKELYVNSISFTIDGEFKTKYTYHYSEEKFERPITDAYKISIHKSFRKDGKVRKKQWVICTMSYYSLIEFWPGDCVSQSKLEEKLKEMGITEEELWDLVYEKLEPLIDEVKLEFERTEEYKTKKKQEKILEQHRKKKYAFEKKYGSDTYDYCYDVFGVLRNSEYLEILKMYNEQQSSYYNSHQSNYNDYFKSSYFTQTTSNYTDEEKAMLKKIYRLAAKKFHPDVTKDDGSMMKFLTKLKEEWGI